jgi:hypothetical protein
MISVTTFLWSDPDGRRNHLWRYGVEHVNVLVNQVDRNLTLPHEFVLVCDKTPEGLDPRVRTVPLDRTTFRPASRFAKLMLFRPDIGSVIGRRILYMDLDSVVTGSLDEIADRTEDIVLWQHPRWPKPDGKLARYNTSIVLLTAGCRPLVWEHFPFYKRKTLSMILCRGARSDDQEWVAHCLGDKEAVWDISHGVYSARWLERETKSCALPDNARFVTFPGSSREPGLPETQAKYTWIKEHRW